MGKAFTKQQMKERIERYNKDSYELKKEFYMMTAKEKKCFEEGGRRCCKNCNFFRIDA